MHTKLWLTQLGALDKKGPMHESLSGAASLTELVNNHVLDHQCQ